MSKRLLEEATIRKFMKLAGTQPLANSFVSNLKEDVKSDKAEVDKEIDKLKGFDPLGLKKKKKEELTEIDELADEMGEEPEVDELADEMGEEEIDVDEEAMEAEAEIDSDDGEVTLEPEEAEVLKGVLEKLLSAMGEEDEGEEELDMEMDMEMDMEEMPAEEEGEEMPAEEEGEEMPDELMENLIKRISARVAKRLLEVEK